MDPDPGGTKTYGMDPTDPDPQHCFNTKEWTSLTNHIEKYRKIFPCEINENLAYEIYWTKFQMLTLRCNFVAGWWDWI